jgi:hypothetical protein
MFSVVGHGFYLALESDMPRVAKRIAQSAWALFEISAADLVLLRQSAERGGVVPQLESLRCIRIEKSRSGLVG